MKHWTTLTRLLERPSGCNYLLKRNIPWSNRTVLMPPFSRNMLWILNWPSGKAREAAFFCSLIRGFSTHLQGIQHICLQFQLTLTEPNSFLSLHSLIFLSLPHQLVILCGFISHRILVGCTFPVIHGHHQKSFHGIVRCLLSMPPWIHPVSPLH